MAAGELRCRRTSSGAITSLVTMIARLTVATITIPVAAEIPPINAAVLAQPEPSASGIDCTQVSGLALPAPPNRRAPARLMGRASSMNRPR